MAGAQGGRPVILFPSLYRDIGGGVQDFCPSPKHRVILIETFIVIKSAKSKTHDFVVRGATRVPKHLSLWEASPGTSAPSSGNSAAPSWKPGGRRERDMETHRSGVRMFDMGCEKKLDQVKHPPWSFSPSR